jgi:hypothetical protein
MENSDKPSEELSDPSNWNKNINRLKMNAL